MHKPLVNSKKKVSKWDQNGRLVIWEYVNPTKGFRGVNFMCDKDGCESVARTLAQLGEPVGVLSRSINVSRPTEFELMVLNYRNNNFWNPFKLILTYDENDQLLDVIRGDSSLTIRVGKSKINQLIEVFRNLACGASDFSISDTKKKNRLNFW